MTAFDRFDPFERRITDAIDEIAAPRPPAYLDDILRQTARTSQRPRWTFPGRWLPADSALTAPGLAWPGGRRAVLVLALVALATAVALVVGSLLAPKPPLGGGGLITVSSLTFGVHVLSPDGASDRTFDRGASCARLSLDGTSAAYVARFGGAYVTRLDDGSHRRIAEWADVNSFGYKQGTWSPDRAHLAFWTTEGTGAALNVLSITDGALSTLVTTMTIGGATSEAAWSPDSNRVAVAITRDGQLTIEIVDLSGVVQQSIGPLVEGIDGPSLSWSPGGDRLLYADRTAQLHIVDLATGAQRALSSHVGVTSYWLEASPWSPDGEWIAFVGADGDLKIISADDAPSRSAPMPQGELTEIAWSPAANVVAVATANGLMTVNADGSNRRELRSFGATTRWGFAWSPDGSRIVVAEDHGYIDGAKVTNLDATGWSAPIVIATYEVTPLPPVELCVSWDQVVANP